MKSLGIGCPCRAADLWCVSIDALAYVSFLENVFRHVVLELADGSFKWRKLADIDFMADEARKKQLAMESASIESQERATKEGALLDEEQRASLENERLRREREARARLAQAGSGSESGFGGNRMKGSGSGWGARSRLDGSARGGH